MSEKDLLDDFEPVGDEKYMIEIIAKAMIRRLVERAVNDQFHPKEKWEEEREVLRARVVKLENEVARLQLQGHSLFGKGQDALALEMKTLREQVTRGLEGKN